MLYTTSNRAHPKRQRKAKPDTRKTVRVLKPPRPSKALIRIYTTAAMARHSAAIAFALLAMLAVAGVQRARKGSRSRFRAVDAAVSSPHL